jgi:hypothetical protein
MYPFQHGGHITKDLYGGVPGVLEGGGYKNTVAPAIDADAVIGVEITGDDGAWEPIPVGYEYQWQYYTTTWVNIALATNKNYTPVDAVFGLPLRLAVRPVGGSTWGYSNATNTVEEVPVQSAGEDVLTDGGLEAWTSPTDLTSWNETVAGTSTVNQESTVIHAGTYAARFDVDASNSIALIQQTNLPVSAGSVVEVAFAARRGAGSGTGRVTVQYVDGNECPVFILQDVYREYSQMMFCSNDNPYIVARSQSAASISVYFDAFSLGVVTINHALQTIYPSGIYECHYTLPGTPKAGQGIYMILRSSDFAAGNYWRVALRCNITTLAWDIIVQSSASAVLTSRISANGIGDTNAFKVEVDGDNWELFTSTDDGANWTSRGTVANALYNTAVGCNVYHSSDFTAGRFSYTPF